MAAVLAGLANCVYHPADYAILTDSIAEDRMGRAFSIHTFAGFVGGAIAPPLLLGLAAIGGLSASLVCAGLLAWATAAVVFLSPISSRPAHASGRQGTQEAASTTASVVTPAVLGTDRLLHPARAVARRHVQLLGGRPDRQPRRVARTSRPPP